MSPLQRKELKELRDNAEFLIQLCDECINNNDIHPINEKIINNTIYFINEFKTN